MKQISALLLAVLLLAPVAARSDQPLPVDERIKLLPYDENDVYTITTRYGYQTNIVFDPHEEIETISVGDRSLWQIIPSGNRLFIRPMEENVITNMTVLTSKRSYQFDLKSISADKEGNIYVAKFVYGNANPLSAPSFPPPPPPLPPLAGPMPFATAPTPPPGITPDIGAGVTHPVHPNYNYSFSGEDALAPVRMYDNGETTFLAFADMTKPLPALFYVDESGREIPAAIYLKDGMMASDRINGEWVLRSPQGTVHVFNETLNPKPVN